MTEVAAHNPNHSPTMTSLEMVNLINSGYTEGEPELRHDTFMAQTSQVLGEGAQNFLDTHIHPQNGQTYPCYKFPKREACLMAMSYSYELQAKVFDRMTTLEGDVLKLTQQLLTTTQEQLKLSHREANRWQDKVIVLEAEQLERASLIEDAKATKVTDLRQQNKASELKATNLNKTIQQLLQQVSTLENALKDQKELTEDAQHEARTAQIRLRAAR